MAATTIVITSGDSAAISLRQAGVAGVVGWKDSPAVGPSPRLDAAAYRALRARYRGLADAAAFQDVDDLPAADDVVLLFDACPYDAGILVRLVDHLRPRAAHLALRVVDAHLAVPRFHGLGQLAPGDLAALLPTAREVMPAQAALCARAWDALRADTPVALAALVRDDTSALPHLAAALRRVLQELPWTSDGRSRLEREALAAIAAGATTTADLVREVAAREEPAHGLWCGDTHLLSVMDGLRAGAVPTRDRWVGGVRVTAPPTWWWDDASGEVVWQ